MVKDLSISSLNDLYGGLLTEKQAHLIKLFYDEDLSLGEIAENEGITRQAAHDAINKGVNALRNYEAIFKVDRTKRLLGGIDASMTKEEILAVISDVFKLWE